ncbi:hypothetical protein L195_g059473, partial [Trifolium pratense]
RFIYLTYYLPHQISDICGYAATTQLRGGNDPSTNLTKRLGQFDNPWSPEEELRIIPDLDRCLSVSLWFIEDKVWSHGVGMVLLIMCGWCGALLQNL